MRTFRMTVVALSAALGLLTLGGASLASAACCSLNGSTCQLIPPLVHGSGFWPGAFCGATVSGTNCVIELDVNQTIGSGDCITLGAGVTLDMKDKKITCTGTSCGSAVVNTASGGSGSRVEIENGVVEGCFARGVSVTGGTNSSVTEMTVDLKTKAAGGASCTTTLPSGIFQPRGTIHRASVTGGLSGIYLYPGEDVTDSVLFDNYVGIDNVGASSAAVNLTNVQFKGNGYAVKNVNPGTYMADIRGSSIQDDAAAPCHCLNASNTCQSNIDDCLDFGTSTASPNTSFIDTEMRP